MTIDISSKESFRIKDYNLNSWYIEITEEEIQTRIQTANTVYDDLVKINHEFLVSMGNAKWKWIFSLNFFIVMYLLWKITAFEEEGAGILTGLHDNTDIQETHELLTDFNELLVDYKPIFIKCVTLGMIRSYELPEDLFNIYTYGGEV